jgi:hypothetical protein
MKYLNIIAFQKFNLFGLHTIEYPKLFCFLHDFINFYIQGIKCELLDHFSIETSKIDGKNSENMSDL